MVTASERTAPQYESFCRIFAYVEEHVGEWEDKPAQERAFAEYLKQNPLYYIPGGTTTRKAYSAHYLRDTIGWMISKHQKSTGAKAVLADFFKAGIKIFDDKWLAKIGWRPKPPANKVPKLKLVRQPERKRPASAMGLEGSASVMELESSASDTQEPQSEPDSKKRRVGHGASHEKAIILSSPTTPGQPNKDVSAHVATPDVTVPAPGRTTQAPVGAGEERMPGQPNSDVPAHVAEPSVIVSQALSGTGEEREMTRPTADQPDRAGDQSPESDNQAMNVDYHAMAGIVAANVRRMNVPVEEQAGVMKELWSDMVDEMLEAKKKMRSPASKEREVLDVGGGDNGKILSSILSSVECAVELYLKQHGVAGLAAADFDPYAKGELAALYSTLFGTEDWKERLIQLLSRQHELGVRDILVGLIGASVYKNVLLSILPWDMTSQIREVLQDSWKYMQPMFDANLYETKRASFHQICDKGFRKTVVAEHARTLARDLVLILQPHFRLLARKPRTNNENLPWVGKIEEAFAAAIELKQHMDCSDWIVYRPVWYAGDEAFDEESHSQNSTNGRPATVIVTLFPGLLATTARGSYNVAKAEVVAQASPEAET